MQMSGVPICYIQTLPREKGGKNAFPSLYCRTAPVDKRLWQGDSQRQSVKPQTRIRSRPLKPLGTRFHASGSWKPVLLKSSRLDTGDYLRPRASRSQCMTAR